MSTEPISACAIDRKRSGVDVDTTFNGFLQFPGAGAVAHVWSSVEGPVQRAFKATGTKGIITIPDAFDEKSPVVVTRGQDEEVREMTSTNRFQVQLDAFSESVLHGKPSEFPVEDGLRNMAAVLALYEAADAGKTVDVEQIQ
jgi:predicted dehydrogenase